MNEDALEADELNQLIWENGGDDADVDVVTVMRAVGERLVGELDEITVERIAEAGARERRSRLGSPPAVITVAAKREWITPVAELRAWRVAAVAAAIVLLSVGVLRALPDPVQVVVADAGELVNLDLPRPDDSTTTTASAERRDNRTERGQEPMSTGSVDSYEPTTTNPGAGETPGTPATPSTQSANPTPDSLSTSIPSTLPQTTTSTLPPTTTSTLPQTTTSTPPPTTTSTLPQTTTSTPPPTTTSTPAGGPVTKSFAVGVAGSVTVRYDAGSIELVSVSPNAGWTYLVEKDDGVQVVVKLSGPVYEATFVAQVDQGSLQIDIDPGSF